MILGLMVARSNIIFSQEGIHEFRQHLDFEHSPPGRFFILVDENTQANCLPKVLSAIPELNEGKVIELESGERSKSLEVVEKVYHVLTELGADKSCTLINLGGGVISDIGGFIAATYKRGLRCIHMPTTLLSQVDASIGGKNGVDLGSLKNHIGTITFPEAVLIHTGFLETLSTAHLRSGFAEMIKHALIADKDLWSELKYIEELEADTLAPFIERAASIKVHIVDGDPYEGKNRKKLNFGHTIGHALEGFSLEAESPDLTHGDAVALGMICECHISNAHKNLKKSDLNDITDFIASHFDPYPIEKLAYHRLIELMMQDKKKRGAKLNLTLLTEIGKSVVDQNPRQAMIIDSLNFLRKYPFRS